MFYLLPVRLLEQLRERTAFRLLKGEQRQRALQFAEHIRIRFASLGHLRLCERERFLDFARPVDGGGAKQKRLGTTTHISVYYSIHTESAQSNAAVAGESTDSDRCRAAPDAIG